MELNTKGRYAVMAMADLAKHAGVGAMSLSAIAKRQHLSSAYLEQLFGRLRRAGLVESQRGRSGGYRLVRPAAQITIAEIMDAVAEPVRMTRCIGVEGHGCVGDERCITHDLWRALGDHIADFLDAVSLQNVIDGMPGSVNARGVTDWTERFGLTS